MEDKSNHMLTIAMISIVFLFFAIIDPILVFAGKGTLADIEDSVMGSDHCPVTLELDL